MDQDLSMPTLEGGAAPDTLAQTYLKSIMQRVSKLGDVRDKFKHIPQSDLTDQMKQFPDII